MNLTYFRPKMRGNVENKNNNPVNIRCVDKTSKIHLRTSYPMSCHKWQHWYQWSRTSDAVSR